ncbi:MAG: hypothetical protein K2W96_08120 [Gemmataceae bacterium]|nr:hypothetical protein [Gemmataceae bacterium]
MNHYLTSVGTSLLTNGAGDLLPLLRDTANLRENELNATQRTAIDGRIDTVRQELSRAELPRKRRMSAELNGMHGLLGPSLKGGSGDLHFLIGTDTYQGRAAVDLVAEMIRQDGAEPQIEIIPGFSTRNQQVFEAGIRELIRFCDSTFKHCRESGDTVYFNLVGSFKALQGYLNTIGMFYADEIVYIFEGEGAELVRIPRLPITLDLSWVEQHRALFAMLATGEHTEPEEVFQGWPEALWERAGQGRGWLSTWGLLLWQNAEESILNERLLDLPRIEYSDKFKRDFDDRRGNRKERIQLQQALARVAVLLEKSGGDTAPAKVDSSLQYDNYTGKHAGVGHFRTNNDGWRATCDSVSGRLRMRRFGDHTINTTP